MDIYVKDRWAFVDLGKGYLLCIGTKDEVEKADRAEIGRMIQEALATSQYHSVKDSQGQRVH